MYRVTRQGEPMTVGQTRKGHARVLEERPTTPRYPDTSALPLGRNANKETVCVSVSETGRLTHTGQGGLYQPPLASAEAICILILQRQIKASCASATPPARDAHSD